ncbi:MAG: isocitrate lyase/phosphoenolpyruvate mutase family protein [Sodalis sp. (in: enterobacteria)]|uniref:isocitrate lyase/phosphoenolpyruvate mutase family protein n=1 Tax=Sodalis sp. (in: enterobacteria) TaxID=1898979 RepID=UPI0039E66FF3
MIIALVEALIAGLGQEEALRRAYAYQEAGADAILIHSRQKTPAEILAFIDAWAGQVPVPLVPTAYPQLTESAIAASGKVGIVIYGNHAIRAAGDAQSLWADTARWRHSSCGHRITDRERYYCATRRRQNARGGEQISQIKATAKTGLDSSGADDIARRKKSAAARAYSRISLGLLASHNVTTNIKMAAE